MRSGLALVLTSLVSLGCSANPGGPGTASRWPADPAGAAPRSAAALFGPWLSLYASFDRGAEADLASGAPKPHRLDGRARFEPGLLGKALRLGVGAGGTRLDFPMRGNLDLRAPGAVSFWVTATGWRPKAPPGERYVRLLRLTGRPGAVFVVERDLREGKQERLLVGFFGLVGGDQRFLLRQVGPFWRPGDWHLLAVNWDSAGFELSVDGGPWVRKVVPGDRIARSFDSSDPKASIALGDQTLEFSHLDDFAVYTRPLSQDDVAALWAAKR